jgi:hypothetical protein
MELTNEQAQEEWEDQKASIEMIKLVAGFLIDLIIPDYDHSNDETEIFAELNAQLKAATNFKDGSRGDGVK